MSLMAFGCAEFGEVRLDPGRVERSTMVGQPLRVVGLAPADVLEAHGGTLALAPDLDVQIGGQVAEIVRWADGGLVVRLAAPLEVGAHPLRVQAFGVVYGRAAALDVVEATVGDAALDAEAGDAATLDGGVRDAALDGGGARDGGRDAGIDGGLDPGMDGGGDVDSGIDSGVDSGIDSGVDSGIDSGVDSGIDSGVDSGIDSGVDAGRDAGVVAVDAGPPDGGGGVLRPCPREPSLRGCFRFERRVVDESASGLTVRTIDEAFTAGLAGDALSSQPTTLIEVQHDAALASTTFSIEAWVWLDRHPASGDFFGVIEKRNQWRLRIDAGGAVGCHVASRWGRREISAGAVPLRRWTHIACSVGGGRQDVFVDGAFVGGRTISGVQTSTRSVHLAEDADTGDHQLAGALDEVRIWSRAIVGAEWCAVSGACGP